MRFTRAGLACALLAPTAALIPGAGPAAAAAHEVVINAALISTTSTDLEYVELFGTPGLSLAGHSIVGIESDAGSPIGNIDHRYDLPADAVIGDNGFFLLGNQYVLSDYGVTPNFNLPDNSLENGSITLALVPTASIGGTSAASISSVLDSVAVTDGGLGDTFAFGAPVVGPDGTFLPAGVRRIADGVDTNTAGDWKLLVFSPRNAPANLPTTGESGPGEPTPTLIHDVQGAGAASPLVGQAILIDGIVVGAPDPDADGVAETFGGFYVQEEDADADADPATSEGIFVFASGTAAVALGDRVVVSGTVVEFGGLTELTTVTSITTVSSGNPLPTATAVSFPLGAVTDLEAFEGMLVTLPQAMVVSEYFNYGRFGEIVVALPADGQTRPAVPTSLYGEDTPEAAALANLNDRSRITIDDGQTAQNVAEPVHPINRELFSLTNAFRGGDTVTGLTGPLHYAFNLYRVMPLANGAGYTTYEQTVAPAQPDEVGGELRVASLNALNYFVTLDNGLRTGCGPDLVVECRGADANQPTEFDRQRVKLLNTIVGLDADVVGLNEIENSRGVEALADIVAGLNDRLGAGTYDYIVAGSDGLVGTDAIKVGLIYRPAAVTPLGAAAVLDTPDFVDPNNTGVPKNRAAVAQTFVDSASREVFSVVINHLKSKGSGCGAGDDHPLAGSCNVTRTLAAQKLADWISTNPTGVTDPDWLILGDLNSYDQESPIEALRAAGFTDLIEQYEGALAYSYVFDGEFGYLDYLMSSPTMTAQVTGATEWHVNSDEPDIFDYDTSFKPNYQDSLFDPSTPARSSDHDAAILGLTLSANDDVVVGATPGTLWSPNHKLRSVVVSASSPAGPATVRIIDATSSEADSGLDPEDKPNDIVFVSDDVVQLRAERFSIEGRTYTLTVEINSGGQVSFDTVVVVVPASQSGGRS